VSAFDSSARPLWVLERFVVTFRTVDGGRHRFEVEAPDYFRARERAGEEIEKRFAPSFVVAGSLVAQRVR
jgi:hypothetical protein